MADPVLSSAINLPVNLLAKFEKFTDHWQPRVVAELNDYQVKLARISGEFIWHDHAETDELFICLEGQMTIEMPDGDVHLGPGDLYVVPRGVAHKPVAHGECKILLLEPRGVVNTGNEQSDRTAAGDRWI